MPSARPDPSTGSGERRAAFTRRHHHGRLFWRVYLHGVTLLVLVAIAVGAVGFALRSGGGAPESARVAAYAAGRIADLAGTPERLSAELRRVREVFGVEATLYGGDGRLLATNVEPPLEAPGESGAPGHPGPVRLRGRGFGWAVPVPSMRGHLVLAGVGHEHAPGRGLLFIGAVLVALALASFPFARSIAAPVERLTDAARALGAGDLSVRANVRARGELGEMGRAFDEMAERLEQLVKNERALLANVSHELRTPLARIRVALELAAEGDLERARRYLGEIGADLAELDALVEDVLAAARLDARGGAGFAVAKDPVDLAAVVEGAAERFRAAHPGRELQVEVAPDIPAVAGDAALLRRLLANLLDNAAKYSEAPSPVTLAVRGPPHPGPLPREAGERETGQPATGERETGQPATGERETGQRTTDEVILEVSDRGIGIDPADLPHLFTPFFRTDRSRARGTGGTGLGLALAKRIAEAHGGRISAASAPGAGTTFRVVLPARRASATEGPIG